MPEQNINRNCKRKKKLTNKKLNIMRTQIYILLLAICPVLFFGQKQPTKEECVEFEKTMANFKKAFSEYGIKYEQQEKKLNELMSKFNSSVDIDKELPEKIQKLLNEIAAYKNDSIKPKLDFFIKAKAFYLYKGFPEGDINTLSGYKDNAAIKKLYETALTNTNNVQKPKENDEAITKNTLKDALRSVIEANKDYEAKIGVIKLLDSATIYQHRYWKKNKKNLNSETNFTYRVLGLKTRRKVFDQIVFECEKKNIDKTKVIDKRISNVEKIRVICDIDSTDSFIMQRIKIDSVKLDINEGLIEYAKVFYNKGQYFYNKKAPIPILELERRANDRLYNTVGDEYIYLKDILDFDYDKRFNFLPDDGTFTLSEKYNTKTLYKNTSVNSLISFTSFSDLLGLLGDQPNSLVSFEGSAKFYLHRKNITDTFLYLFPSIQPHFHYNKLDSKFDMVNIGTADQSKTINAVEVYRRNAYSVGIDLTAFRWDWRPSNSLEIKGGYSYAATIGKVDNIDVKFVNHLKFAELNLKSKIINNFGIETYARYIWLDMKENEELKKGGYTEESHKQMIAFRGGVYYMPPKGKGKDKIFLRFTNYVVFNGRSHDFSQLQVGFTKALDL